MSEPLEQRVKALSCWKHPPVRIQRLEGGLSNITFALEDGTNRFVVRCGADIPVHHVFRDHEAMVSRAAFLAGISPELVHVEPGFQVSRFIQGRTFSAVDIGTHISAVLDLVRRCHQRMRGFITGPGRCFWVFHMLRDYADTLKTGNSAFLPQLPPYLALIEKLEALQVPMPVIFGHHDLLPANFIHDGTRLWLIDWEYGAFGTPMFDLANLATNAGFSPDEEAQLLGAYFGCEPDATLIKAFDAMKVASTLREAMWAMVSALHLSVPGVDYNAYAARYLVHTHEALTAFAERHGSP